MSQGSSRGRHRTLTAEERRLWADIARSVRPLAPFVPRGVDPAPPPAPASSEASPTALAPPRKAETARAAAPHPRPAPPLAALDRRTVRALARGRRSAEAVLDLHGLTQAQAHGRLIRFLRTAQADGQGLVLVITGRGGPDGSGERGVLRRMAPLWLGLPEMRGVVLGFDEAGPRQGGAGALYVRLRRAGRAL